MLTVLLASGQHLAALDPTKNAYVVVGVPVVVALIGASAAVSVAVTSSRTQRRIAAAERSESRRSAERATASSVMEDIADQITAIKSDYAMALSMPITDGFEPLQDDWHPSRAALDRALARLMTRLDCRSLYRASMEWLDALEAGMPTSESSEAMSVLQHRLEDWFLGERELSATIRRLERDANKMRQGHQPAISA